MINDKTIAVVVPAYNEETQIALVIESMPDYVDRIIVINDCSKDKTAEVVIQKITEDKSRKTEIKPFPNKIIRDRYNQADIIRQKHLESDIKNFMPSTIFNKYEDTDRIILINHEQNGGKGAALARGYKWCLDHNIDCTAVMDGDGQMDPSELFDLVQPIINNESDYIKGNRLSHKSAWFVIPKIRFIGNSILSILTKIASGYWHISDTQCGYTAISSRALNKIDISSIYKDYGVYNDLLVKLNIANCTVKENEIKPVYNIGEESKLKINKLVFTLSSLLIASFIKRLWIKYFVKDFHPLFIFYNFSLLLFFVLTPYAIKIASISLKQQSVNPVTLIFFSLLFISCIQFLSFAMWMDILDNERLYKQ